MDKSHGYIKKFKKEGIPLKLTLYFNRERRKKLEKIRFLDACTKLSMASTVENIVNEKLDGVKL